MAKRQIENVEDVLRVHTTDIQATPAERLSKFLALVATELPGRYVTKRVAAKIAFAQKRLPGEESDYVKKRLPSALQRTKILLQDEYGHDLYMDRVEGLRAAVGDEDIATSTHRQKRRRVAAAIKSYKRTDDLVSTQGLSNKTKAELQRTRQVAKGLDIFERKAPLLLPKKNKDDEDNGG